MECAPYAANVSKHTQFFTRSFSTYVDRGVAAFSLWMHRKRRFISFEGR